MAVIINGTTGITNVNGTAAAPAETGTDTDSGIVYGTNTVSLATNGTTALTVDSSQNVGIGTSSPTTRLAIGRVDSASEGGQIDLCRSSDNASAWAIDVYGNTSTPSLRFVDNVAAASRASIDSSGNFQFNSGYGSVATVYGCRAWVAFNGTTAPPTILASGNVTSVTKSAAGTYTVNFTTAMPDANYSAVASVDGVGIGNPAEAMSSVSRGNTTSAAKVTTISTSGSATDYVQINVAIFR